MPFFLRQLLLVLGFDLKIATKNARALVFIALYTLAGLAMGAAFLSCEGLAHKQFEKGVAEYQKKAEEQGVDQPAPTKAQAMRQVLLQLAENDEQQADYLGEMPLIVYWFFRGTLFFLPLLILLMSFDLIAADVQTRAVRYVLTRTTRLAYVLGKVSSHLALLGVVLLAQCLAVLALSLLMVDDFALAAGLRFLAQFWLELLLYGTATLGVVALCSMLARTTFGALSSGLLVLFVLLALSFTKNAESGVRYLHYLSPLSYAERLSNHDPMQVIGSLVLCMLFGATMLAAGYAVFAQRDL